MVRRSTPQKTIDDRSFPIRILVATPKGGFGQAYDEISAWLRNELGAGNYALHSAWTHSRSCAFFFRAIDDADRFLEAFPSLQLADQTRSPVYSSPARAAGLG